MSRVHDSLVDCGGRSLLKKGMVLTNKQVGEQLARLEAASKLSATKICELVDCEPSAWSNYKSGIRRLGEDVGDRLCDKFGLTFDWLYRGNSAHLAPQLQLALERAIPKSRKKKRGLFTGRDKKFHAS